MHIRQLLIKRQFTPQAIPVKKMIATGLLAQLIFL